jgi:HPt (histidine-containing phosphotransfer) domain-containing protein
MIDKEKFLATKELMGESFDDFLQLFFSELENDIKIIKNADDFETIALKAHSQKSSCGLLGATQLQEIFANIEQLAKDNQNTDDLVAKLPESLTQLKQNL